MVERVMLMVECVFVLCTTFALVIKTNSIMKEIKIVEKGENFTTVNVGAESTSKCKITKRV